MEKSWIKEKPVVRIGEKSSREVEDLGNLLIACVHIVAHGYD